MSQPLRSSPRPLPRQQLLALEPAEDELHAELLRIWLGRAYWRQRFKTLDDLLADPQRAAMLRTCARQAWRARLRATSRT